ncbi:Cell division protein ftsX [Candidatus Magnetomorum sp. HK-1]|nr:Cell division protein ftsX [Candidatus Magnetomorum sp. HK-1]
MNYLICFFKGVLKDFIATPMLHTVTVLTIALSLLVTSAFGLFFININQIFYIWKQGIRIMAYVSPAVEQLNADLLKDHIKTLYGVNHIEYISKDDALGFMKNDMQQGDILSHLKENPLPASFMIHVKPTVNTWETIEKLASQIQMMPEISEVEYGKGWLERITSFMTFFRITCIAIGTLLIITTLFVISNTIRLVFYARRDEIDVMSLVGATRWFIKIPFYIEAVVQGFIGGIIGVTILYGLFYYLTIYNFPVWTTDLFQPHFFSLHTIGILILLSMGTGWTGCYISLKQFIRL